MALKLNLQIVTRADISNLLHELSSLNNHFMSAGARSPGSPVTPPKTTRLLDQLARDNQIDLQKAPDRQALQKDLETISAKAPMLHISFASEPSPQALEKILAWLRSNIDQYVLLQVGLQPTIAAGCILRTPNKIFDMSVRASLIRQEPLLTKLIAGDVNESR